MGCTSSNISKAIVSFKNDHPHLLLASEHGDVDTVDAILKINKVLIDAQDKDGNSALIYASFDGHHQVVKRLLDGNANIEIRNEYGATPLICASYNGHVDCVKALLARHAEVEAQDHGWASIEGCKKMGIALDDINKYLDKEGLVLSDCGDTALMAASSNGHVDVVMMLLSNDANVNFHNKAGQTALSAASDEGHLEVVRMLLDRNSNVDFQDKAGLSALMIASGKGHLEVVRMLLDRYANVDLLDTSGLTALIYAVINGHSEVVQALLQRSPNIDSRDHGGYTALMWAADYGFVDIVTMLLQSEAKVEIQDNAGLTALVWARGNIEIVRALIESNADVNITDHSGYTVLMNACMGGFTEIVRILLEKNADVHIQNYDGDTALNLARRSGHFNCMKILLGDAHNELVVVSQTESCCIDTDDHICALAINPMASSTNERIDFVSESRDNVECPICLEKFILKDDIVWSLRQTSCNHVFHKYCFNQWIETSPGLDCPCCRRSYFFSPEESREEVTLPCLESRRQGRYCIRHGLIFSPH